MAKTVTKWCLVCLLIATVIPVSMGVAILPIGGEPPPLASSLEDWYPCKEHRCGCTSSQACKLHCCCNPRDEAATVESADGSEKSPAGTVSLSVEMRSATCSGHGPWIAVVDNDWRADSATSVNLDLPFQSILDVSSNTIPEGLHMVVNPPPPRA